MFLGIALMGVGHRPGYGSGLGLLWPLSTLRLCRFDQWRLCLMGTSIALMGSWSASQGMEAGWASYGPPSPSGCAVLTSGGG